MWLAIRSYIVELFSLSLIQKLSCSFIAHCSPDIVFLKLPTASPFRFHHLTLGLFYFLNCLILLSTFLSEHRELRSCVELSSTLLVSPYNFYNSLDLFS